MHLGPFIWEACQDASCTAVITGFPGEEIDWVLHVLLYYVSLAFYYYYWKLSGCSLYCCNLYYWPSFVLAVDWVVLVLLQIALLAFSY